MRMARGWSREVRARLGGARSCTHVMEILIPLATADYQSLGLPARGPAGDAGCRRPASLQIDSCYAYAAEGEVVLRRWPRFHPQSGARDEV